MELLAALFEAHLVRQPSRPTVLPVCLARVSCLCVEWDCLSASPASTHTALVSCHCPDCAFASLPPYLGASAL